MVMVLTALLFASETWTLYSRHEKVLNRFHINSIKKLLRITWQNMLSVQTILRTNQLRWAGHVARMDDGRLPKQVLYCEFTDGERNVGRQKKRFKATFKASMKDFGIDPDSWEDQSCKQDILA